MSAPDKDLLSAEERETLRKMRGSSAFTEHLAAIIDRLAPRPAPPAPRVSELAERMRSHPGLREWADGFDAAMERWRERLRLRVHNQADERVSILLEKRFHTTYTQARAVAHEIADILREDPELEP